MSFYLKYRPQRFDDIVGQEFIKDILKNQVKKSNILHSYLFQWPRGTWKTSTARIFAKAINCENPQDGNPCNNCNACQSINQGTTLDVVEIDAASYTQVDNIREVIIEKINYPPSNLKKKVYIIDEVHMLSKSAFNALLKVMEEPPSYVVFILATTEIQKVPDTIVSRCQVFNFKNLTKEQIVGYLKKICQKESLECDNLGLEAIAVASEGALRDAIKYLQQVSVLGKVDVETVKRFLGIVDQQAISDLLNLIKQQDYEWVKALLTQLYEKWIDFSYFVKQILGYIEEIFTTDPDFLGRVWEVLIKSFQQFKYISDPVAVMLVNIASLTENKDTSPKKSVDEKKASFWWENGENTTSLESAVPWGSKLQCDVPKVSISPEELKERLIQKIKDPSLEGAIKKYLSFEEVTKDVVKGVVINKFYYTRFMKDEVLFLIKNALADILDVEDVEFVISYKDPKQLLIE